MVALAKEVSPCLCLDQLTVEVDRILDGLVLDWQNFDALDDLIKEELCEDVVRGAADALLP